MASREEHQAKMEAYENVLLWSESETVDKADILWYLNEKIRAHRGYVEKFASTNPSFLEANPTRANGHAMTCLCEDCGMGK